MYRILKLLAGLLVLLCISCACAEELPEAALQLLPEGGIVESCVEAGGMRLYTVRIARTGEELSFVCDGQGDLLSIETQKEADFDPNAVPVERVRAEELLQAEYPGCRILFVRAEGALKRIGVAAEGFCGVVTVADDRICSRSLEMGEIYRKGVLTMEGALQVLRLHRSEADFRALELDEDDGNYVYEGEAMVRGVEYEFELDVFTGRLLEWERD